MLSFILYAISIYFGIMFFGLLILGWANRHEGKVYNVDKYLGTLERIKQGKQDYL